MADAKPSTAAGSNEIANMLVDNAAWLENYSWDMRGKSSKCFDLIVHELRVAAETIRRGAVS